MALSTSVRLGRMLVKGGRVAWKHRKKFVAAATIIKETVETVGPYAQRAVVVIAERVTVRYKICREHEQRVLDAPLSEKFVIARRGERCHTCRRKVDAFGNPIPGTEKRSVGTTA